MCTGLARAGLGVLLVVWMIGWAYPFVRFFARIRAAQVGCPGCGMILLIGSGPAKGWDRTTSTLECYSCHRKWQLGIIAWEVQPRAPKGGNAIPKDQRLTLREQAQLRSKSGGFWPEADKKRVEDPVNRFIAGECVCDPLPWRAECPVHGGEKRG